MKAVILLILCLITTCQAIQLDISGHFTGNGTMQIEAPGSLTLRGQNISLDIFTFNSSQGGERIEIFYDVNESEERI